MRDPQQDTDTEVVETRYCEGFVPAIGYTVALRRALSALATSPGDPRRSEDVLTAFQDAPENEMGCDFEGDVTVDIYGNTGYGYAGTWTEVWVCPRCGREDTSHHDRSEIDY